MLYNLKEHINEKIRQISEENCNSLLKDIKENLNRKSYHDLDWGDTIKMWVLPKLVNIHYAKNPKIFLLKSDQKVWVLGTISEW